MELDASMKLRIQTTPHCICKMSEPYADGMYYSEWFMTPEKAFHAFNGYLELERQAGRWLYWGIHLHGKHVIAVDVIDES